MLNYKYMKTYKVALQGSGFVNWLRFDQPMTFNEDLVLTQVFETLFNKNEFGKIDNNLISEYKLINQQLILKLQKRYFQDGSHLTAIDVVSSLKQAFNSPYKHNNNGWTGDFLTLLPQDLKVIDDTSFSIHIGSNKVNDVIEELCKVRYSIRKNVFGTGPYKINKQKSQDQKLILESCKLHPSHSQCVDELHLIGYKNNFETLKAFLNKEVDQIRVWGLKSPFKYNPNTLLIPSKTFYASYFQFNTKNNKFINSKQRTHFRDIFLSNIMLHKDYPWNRFTGVIPSKKFSKPVSVYKKNQTTSVTLGVAHKRQKKEVERIIDKELLKNYGYTVKIKNYNSYEKLYNSDSDLIYTAFSYEQHNKKNLPQIFHSKHRKNKTGFSNKNLDDLIQKDTKLAEKLIWSESLVIPLGWFQCHILTHKDSQVFCGIKNNKVTPVLYESKIQDFIKLFSSSQNEVFKLREKDFSHLSQKEKVDEIVSQFQHDIKSPLSVLNLMIKSYSRSEDGYNRVLNRIEEFNEDIKNEINNALKNKKNMYIKTTNLNLLLNEVYKEKLIEHNKLPNLNFLLCSSEQDINIKINPIKFKRIISNLLNNAIESRDKWKHQVEITMQQNKSKVSICIRDNGRGFTKDHLNKVLSKAKVTNKTKGKGLGLYNAKQYFESLGGELLINSTAHHFCEITIILRSESQQLKQSL